MHIDLSTEQLVRIKRFRHEIRWHRDQRGDDRCWLDDFRVWRLLEDTPSTPMRLPLFMPMMELCTAFHTYRRADVPDPLPAKANRNRATWDDDLLRMCSAVTYGELIRLQDAVRLHRDTAKKRQLTIDDDRALYSVLLELIPADFCLPSRRDFLEDGKPNAGCPAFWRSHQACASDDHDIHRWGPCPLNAPVS